MSTRAHACFVIVHATRDDDFFTDLHFRESAGELRAAGHDASVVHVWLEPGREQDATGALIDHLRALDASVIVVDQLEDPSLLLRMRHAGHVRLVCVDPWANFGDAMPDVMLHHVHTHGRALTSLVAALLDGRAIDDVPNVDHRLETTWRRSRAGRAPVDPLARPFCPVPDVIHLPAGVTPPIRRVTLQPSPGCPYDVDVLRNSHYADVPMPSALASRGCAFCHMGGDYSARSNADSVAFVRDRVRVLRRADPALAEVVLSDQFALRYVADLFDGEDRELMRGLCVLVPARPDQVLRFASHLERAIAAAARSQATLAVHLMGFESLSPHLAAIYNKHESPERWPDICLAAVRGLRTLARLHPTTFVLDRYGTSSFILFSPWTTLDDLRVDSNAIEAHDLGAFSAGAPFSKLRLYPNLPLYWKAKAEGFLLSGEAAASNRTGYSMEHSWRFGDASVSRAHELVMALRAHVSNPQWPSLLCAVVSLVEREQRGDARPLDVALIAQAFSALREAVGGKHHSPVSNPDRSAHRTMPVRTSRTIVLPIGSRCNNDCVACVGLRRTTLLDDRIAVLDYARTIRRDASRVVLVGREPTLLPDLPRLIEELRGVGFDEVHALTNGRRLAYPAYAHACVAAGLDRILVKWAGPDAASQDAWTHVDGSLSEARRGVSNYLLAARSLRRGARVTLYVIAHAKSASTLETSLDAAHDMGADAVHVHVPVRGIDLDQLPHITRAIEITRDKAAARRMPLECDGL